MSQSINQHTPTERHLASRRDTGRDADYDAAADLAPWQSLLAAVRDAFPARLDTTNPSLALTRVVVEATEHLNYPVRPTPVFVDITRGSQTHARREGGIDERALLHTPLGWAGHLIALVDLDPGRRVLLDASADRFDRPIRNLLIGGPLATIANNTTTLACIRPRPSDDTTITYRLMPPTHSGRDGWSRSPWWQPGADTATAVRAAQTATHTASSPPPRVNGQAYSPASSLPKTHPKAG